MCVCVLPRLVPGPVTAVVTQVPRAGLAHPLLWPVLYLSEGLLIELGVDFLCVLSQTRRVILRRVLEGSEIHLERVREFSVFLQ